jgi:VWFA-related protein
MVAVWPAALALLLFSANGPARGQTPPQPQTSAAKPVVSSTQEVVADLVVRDKKGRPVTNLKPGDIEVLDGNSPVHLSELRLVNAAAGGHHLVALLFDRLDAAAAQEASHTAQELVKADRNGGLLFGVFMVYGRLHLVHEFTSDHEALKTAIAVATGTAKRSETKQAGQAEEVLQKVARTGLDASGASVSIERRKLAEMTLALLLDSQRAVENKAVAPSISDLLSLVRGEASAAGKKDVVYFQGSTRVDTNTRDAIRSIVPAANRAKVSVYVVDASPLDQKAGEALSTVAALTGSGDAGQTGVVAPGAGPGTVDTGSLGLGTMIQQQEGRIEGNAVADTQNPLAQLAGATGGGYMYATGDAHKTARNLFDDLSTWYEAAWTPPVQQFNGSYRTIRVKPVRKGLIVQARAGYFAVAPSAGAAARPMEAPLLKILGQSPLPTEVPFRAKVIRFGKTPLGDLNTVIAEIPLSGLEVREDGNTKLFSAHASILVQVKDKNGQIIEQFSQDMPHQGAAEDRQRSSDQVLSFERHFTASPGDYVLETAVADENSGKMGAQRLAFTVPEPTTGPFLSDMVLVRRVEPFDPKTDPSEPMHFGNEKIIPDLSGEVALNAQKLSLFFVLHTDSSSSVKPDLVMQVQRDGKQIARSQLALDKTGLVPYLASIPGTALAPGRYTITAILTQGGTVQSGASFTIAGREESAAPHGGLLKDVSLPSPDVSVPDTVARRRKPLVITTPTTGFSRPSQADISALIRDARERAVHYTETLPNFMCVEVTHRSIDPSGHDHWRHRDTLTELLRYRDNREQRTTLEVNGVRATTPRGDLKGTISHGEFGGLLDAIFAPDVHAAFHWKSVANIGPRTVQVFDYSVPRGHSTFSITDDKEHSITVPFHGLVYIDSSTHGVRRLTMVADGIPHDFGTHSASFSVDYDYIAIGDHDYLLPIAGTLGVTRGRHLAVDNEIEFVDYRRYGAESTVQFGK